MFGRDMRCRVRCLSPLCIELTHHTCRLLACIREAHSFTKCSNQQKTGACGRVGVRQMLEYITVGVATEGTCVHTSAVAQCYCCKTPTVAVITPTNAALYIVLPLQPPTAAAVPPHYSCYCCKSPTVAVITRTTAALYFVLPLLPPTATPPQLLHSTHLYAEPGKWNY